MAPFFFAPIDCSQRDYSEQVHCRRNEFFSDQRGASVLPLAGGNT
jgi:hypothetical protein